MVSLASAEPVQLLAARVHSRAAACRSRHHELRSTGVCISLSCMWLCLQQHATFLCVFVRAGEEVTISYGAFPNDVFLLFFGFVPDPNPHDAVPLFADLLDLVTAAAEAAAQQREVQPARSAPSTRGIEREASTPATERAGAAAATTLQPGGSATRPGGGEPATAAAARGASTAGAATEAAEGASTAWQQASGSPLTQQTAQRLEEQLLDRLPAGDYSRCTLVVVCVASCTQLYTCPRISGTRLHVVSNSGCTPWAAACACRLVCTLGGLDQRLHLALLALPAVMPGCDPGASPVNGRLIDEASCWHLVADGCSRGHDVSLCNRAVPLCKPASLCSIVCVAPRQTAVAGRCAVCRSLSSRQMPTRRSGQMRMRRRQCAHGAGPARQAGHRYGSRRYRERRQRARQWHGREWPPSTDYCLPEEQACNLRLYTKLDKASSWLVQHMEAPTTLKLHTTGASISVCPRCVHAHCVSECSEAAA